VNLLALSLFIFMALLLYQITSRVFALSGKQEEVRDLVQVYAEAAGTLEMRLKVLNLTVSSPFSEE
jgi:hypothetical protein